MNISAEVVLSKRETLRDGSMTIRWNILMHSVGYKRDDGRLLRQGTAAIRSCFYSIMKRFLSIVLRLELEICLCMVADGTDFRRFLADDDMSAI